MNITEDDKFLSLLSQEFRQAILELAPAIVDLPESELKSLVKPQPIDYALKTSFWREYTKCESVGGVVSPRDVYGAVATPQYFQNAILNSPFKLAWLCRPHQVYEQEVEALLARGTERLWELMDIDIYKADGTVDPKRGHLVLDTIKMVEQRAKGLAVARVQQVNVNVNAPKQISAHGTDIDIDERIRQLESELRRLPPTPEVIDVRTDEERVLDALGAEEEAAEPASSSLRD